MCTLHNSCAVLAYEIFVAIPYTTMVLRLDIIIHRTWITMKKGPWYAICASSNRAYENHYITTQ